MNFFRLSLLPFAAFFGHSPRRSHGAKFTVTISGGFFFCFCVCWGNQKYLMTSAASFPIKSTLFSPWLPVSLPIKFTGRMMEGKGGSVDGDRRFFLKAAETFRSSGGGHWGHRSQCCAYSSCCGFERACAVLNSPILCLSGNPQLLLTCTQHKMMTS